MTTLISKYINKKYLLWCASAFIAALFINKFGSKILYHFATNVPGITSNPTTDFFLLALLYLLLTLALHSLFTLIYPQQILDWLISRANNRAKKFIPVASTADVRVDESIRYATERKSLVNFGARIWIAMAGSAFVYLFSEWLFLVTKPSFMDAYSFWEKFMVLVGAFSTLAIFLIPVWLLVLTSRAVFGISRFSLITSFIAGIIPAGFLSITGLLLIDNFTYTILGFGIVNTESLTRAFYLGLLFLFVLFTLTKWITFFKSRHHERIVRLLAIVFLAVMVFGSFFQVIADKPARQVTDDSPSKGNPTLPNIILLGSDGVNAERMSIYGYERETTPILDSLAGSALIAKSNFTNSGQSSGSIVSIFTGRLPYATKVVNVPGTLQNADAYLHLPRILRELGYTNTSITYTRYLDAYSLNFQDGFARVNGKSIDTNPVMRLLSQLSSDRVQYFLMTSFERVSDRINHIFFIQQMPNPFGEVYSNSEGEDREKRLNELFELIDTGKRPFFVHVHLMGTHGPRYAPEIRVFSSGVEQNKDGMQEYYDDSILDFDHYIGEVIDRLENADIRENTVIIIYSDHPRTRVVPKRIPLIFLFPEGKFAGTITGNTQNIDIAPTILDYLGQPIPDWMDGVSLLDGAPDLGRPVLGSAARAKITDNPFFSFGIFSEVVCQNYVYYTVKTGEWTLGEVDGAPTPCREQDILTHEEIKENLIQELFSYGFNTDLIQP